MGRQVAQIEFRLGQKKNHTVKIETGNLNGATPPATNWLMFHHRTERKRGRVWVDFKIQSNTTFHISHYKIMMGMSSTRIFPKVFLAWSSDKLSKSFLQPAKWRLHQSWHKFCLPLSQVARITWLQDFCKERKKHPSFKSTTTTVSELFFATTVESGGHFTW